MKRIFIKYWWLFPILLTISPFMLTLSKPIVYHSDWGGKILILLLWAFVFILTLTALLVSWIVLLKNKQWWKALISLLAAILIVFAILWSPLLQWLGIGVQ